MILFNQNIALNTPYIKKEEQITLNVAEYFYAQVEKNPYQIAIIEKDTSITYLELKEAVLKTAAYFQLAGIKKGDRVLVFVPISVSLYRIVLALFHIGATAVFLDEWSTTERLRKACEVADCYAFIGNWKAKALGVFIKQIRKIPVWLSSRLPAYEAISSDPIVVNDSDPALITFTTGSTGMPKAADRTHHFLNAQMNALNEELDMHPGMIDMPALPVFVLLNLGNGLVSILPDANMRKPQSIKIEKVIHQLKEYKVERIIASPFLIKAIANYLVAKNLTLTSLKEVYTGGAPIFPNDAELFLNAFGDIRMEAVYGSTEAEPISSIAISALASSRIKKGLPVGDVSPGTELKIITYKNQEIDGKEFDDVELDQGLIGEIVVTGKHVLKEYYKNPAAIRRNKIRHQDKVWHRTGDAGYLDENGKLFLVGRCDQLIYHDDQFYSPFVYEYLMQQVDGVTMGTILIKENILIVMLETKGQYDHEALNKIFNGVDTNVIATKNIPRDPRHHSKIDYKKLELLLVNHLS